MMFFKIPFSKSLQIKLHINIIRQNAIGLFAKNLSVLNTPSSDGITVVASGMLLFNCATPNVINKNNTLNATEANIQI